VAASLAHFGLDAQFVTKLVTKLPDNPVGEACLGHLRRYGVGTDHVVHGGDRLGIYFLEPGASQRPSTVTYDRAGSAVTTLTPRKLTETPSSTTQRGFIGAASRRPSANSFVPPYGRRWKPLRTTGSRCPATSTTAQSCGAQRRPAPQCAP